MNELAERLALLERAFAALAALTIPEPATMTDEQAQIALHLQELLDELEELQRTQ